MDSYALTQHPPKGDEMGKRERLDRKRWKRAPKRKPWRLWGPFKRFMVGLVIITTAIGWMFFYLYHQQESSCVALCNSLELSVKQFQPTCECEKGDENE